MAGTEYHADWNGRMMTMAALVASWSKDPSTQVGAVITDTRRRVLGVGYNGFARGVEDTEERYADRGIKYPMVVHAELNAIHNAHSFGLPAYLYCTLFPCSQCAAQIIQSPLNIIKVFAPEPDASREADAHYKLSFEQFHEAGVQVLNQEVPVEREAWGDIAELPLGLPVAPQ